MAVKQRFADRAATAISGVPSTVLVHKTMRNPLLHNFMTMMMMMRLAVIVTLLLQLLTFALYTVVVQQTSEVY